MYSFGAFTTETRNALSKPSFLVNGVPEYPTAARTRTGYTSATFACYESRTFPRVRWARGAALRGRARSPVAQRRSAGSGARLRLEPPRPLDPQRAARRQTASHYR